MNSLHIGASALVVITACACAAANASEPCFSAAARIDKAVGTPTQVNMQAFLRTFSDPRCRGNTEYSETGNELIFDAIEKHPAQFFGTLFALGEREMAAVQANIDNPLHDCINVARRVEAVRQSRDMPDALKQRALQFLEAARRKEAAMIRAWEIRNNRKWSWDDCAR